MNQFVKQLRETGSIMGIKQYINSRPVHSAENIDAVAQRVCEHASASTLHRFRELNISRIYLRRILYKDIGLKAYKVQLAQETKPHDHPMHFQLSG